MDKDNLMTPEELAKTLKDFCARYPDNQTAAGMFGLLYAEHLSVGSRERSPNTIARKAGLGCGPDILTGFKMARHVKREIRFNVRRTGPLVTASFRNTENPFQNSHLRSVEWHLEPEAARTLGNQLLREAASTPTDDSWAPRIVL